MSFTVFLGNLPTWVTADDIRQWLAAEDLVADAVKVIRNHETQESKGFAFVEAPTRRRDAVHHSPLRSRAFGRPAVAGQRGTAPEREGRRARAAASRGAQRRSRAAAASSGTQEARRPAERAIAPQRLCERAGKGPVSHAAAALALRRALLFHSTPVNRSHNGLHGISFPFNMLETVLRRAFDGPHETRLARLSAFWRPALRRNAGLRHQRQHALHGGYGHRSPARVGRPTWCRIRARTRK